MSSKKKDIKTYTVQGETRNSTIIQGENITNIAQLPEFKNVTVHEDADSANKSPDRDLLIQLRQFFDTRFSEDELRTICFDLGIDYDNLPSVGKAGKARELVAYYKRYGRISELITVARRLRPDVSWADAVDQYMPPERLPVEDIKDIRA